MVVVAAAGRREGVGLREVGEEEAFFVFASVVSEEEGTAVALRHCADYVITSCF